MNRDIIHELAGMNPEMQLETGLADITLEELARWVDGLSNYQQSIIYRIIDDINNYFKSAGLIEYLRHIAKNDYGVI